MWYLITLFLEKGVNSMIQKEKEIVEIEIPSKAVRVKHAMCSHGHSLMDKDHPINNFPSIVSH